MPLHRVWEYRDIGRLFITVGGGKRVIIGVLRWSWVETILRVSLEVILRKLLRQSSLVGAQSGDAPSGESSGECKVEWLSTECAEARDER